MKIIIRKCSLKKNETKKIMKVIYFSFFLYNQKDANKDLCEKIEKIYGPKANIIETRKHLGKSKILLIAKEKNNIIGIIRGKRNFIRSLYITPNYVGLGIGTQLLRTFEKIAKCYGSKRIRLQPSIFAKEFYTKEGYTPLNETFVYKYL